MCGVLAGALAVKTGTLYVLLAASVALNTFLGGREAAHQLRPRPDPLSVEHIVRRLEHRLSDADRDVFRAAVASRADRLDHAGLALRAAREDLRAALTAASVDQAALARACARTRQSAQASYAIVHEALVEAAPRLSAQGRRALLRPMPAGKSLPTSNPPPGSSSPP